MFTETQKQGVTEEINIVLSSEQKMILQKKNNKKLLLGNRGLFLLFLDYLVHLKLMDAILDGFFLVSINGLPINLMVRIDIINEKFIGSFRFNRTGWILAFGVNGDMGQVQVWEGSLDLTKAVVEAVDKRTSHLG